MTNISLQDLSIQVGVGVQSSLRTIDNPLDGVLPDFTVFGAEFTELWQKLLGGLWALAIIAAVIFIIVGVVNMAHASTSNNPQEHKHAQKQAVGGGIALGVLAALGVIVGAILAAFS